jgi:hypothetical protein
MRYEIFKYLETIDTPTDRIFYYDVFNAKFSNFNYRDNLVEHTITEKESERFYLVSDRYYGTVDYADVLFLINGLTDPFNIKPGTKIKIPTEEDIEGLTQLIQEPYTNDQRYETT